MKSTLTGMALGALGLALGATLATVPGTAQATTVATVAASASDTHTTLTRRATLRDTPGRLVLANALEGDVVDVQGTCGSWARVQVIRPADGHAMATSIGWLQRSALRRNLSVGDACGQAGADESRWAAWVRAINAPFRSVRRDTKGIWRRATYGTRVDLNPAAGCAPAYNYVRNPGDGNDQADPSQLVANVDYDEISYRYQTTDGAFSLVNVGRSDSAHHAWSFVPSICLQSRNGRPIAFAEVARLDDLSGYPSDGIESATSLHRRGCTGGVRVDATFGWLPEASPGSRPGCPV